MFKRTALLAMMLLTLLLTTIGIAAPRSVAAATRAGCDPKASSFLGIPKWYKYLNTEFTATSGESGNCDIVIPKDADGHVDIQRTVGPILLAVTEILLRVGTYLAIGVIVWGGIQYQISQGEPERTKNARSMIINAVVGLVIAIFATAIVNLVGRNVF